MVTSVTRKLLGTAALLIALLVLLTVADEVFADSRPILKVSTIPLPPIVTIAPDTGHISGLAVESVRQMAQACGADVEFIAPPAWSRALAMAREGTTDALIPTNFSQERTEFFDFHPHALLDLGPALMVRADSAVQDFLGLEQLRGRRIAIQQNILIEPKFDAFIRSDAVDLIIRGNAKSLVAELLTGRVEFIADSKAVLEHYLGETGVLKRVRTLEPPIGSAPQHLAFSKKRSLAFAADTKLFKCLMAAKP
ncbi:substrate-binding periplasmic protein [Kordiimonas lacus]|uniref:ABC-type amino acid transport substrate-binding protein n=1 Tax=Kordiimonas lacus TaxID=637679 RepID=A0A1G6Y805_9PROT|nr:transporter substrate-binding domain-containing protein [Kordiimonas lacus]SDD86480.1 ABC-type amino acid transport substrate-binding protein [Kordiimonas lacus]